MPIAKLCFGIGATAVVIAFAAPSAAKAIKETASAVLVATMVTFPIMVLDNLFKR